MADRTVKVSLFAVTQQYDQAMKRSAAETAKLGGEGKKLEQMKAAFDTIGRAGIGMGAVIGAGVTLAIAKFADFDAAMSNVQAATHETSENMAALRDAAVQAGASTVFSATEAAGAIEELAKAGVSTADILGGALAGSLDLAAAGQLGVARAAEITSTAMNQFGLDGDQAAHVADVLAAGAGKAMGSVDDLAQGLKFVGPVAASMGVSLEETTGVLALFAQQGIIGEQAGTSLRGVLASLTSPSAQARAEIERLGISLYDSQGNFLGLQNAAQQLSTAYGEMDGASRDASLGIIFGRETVTAATALYQAGAEGVQEWTQAVDDSGYAAETARTRLDNLKGDLEALAGAMDAALIQTGSAANDTLRAVVQSITGLVDIFNDLPKPVQEATLIIGGATAAVTLAGGAAFLAVPKFLEMRNTVAASGLSMGRLGLQAGVAGLALGGLFAIVGQLASRQAELQSGSAEFADTLDELTGAVTGNTREMIAKKLADEGAFEGAKRAGVSQRELTDALYEGGDAVDAVRQKLYDYANGNPFDTAIAGSVNSLNSLNDQLQGAKSRHEDLQAAEEESVESTESAADAYLTAADSASTLTDQLSQLIEKVNEANGVGQDVVSTNIAYRDALAEVDAAIASGNVGLDQNTEAGRNNLGMLNDLAGKAQEAAQKQLELDGNTDAYLDTLNASRDALIQRAQDLGYNADEALRLADMIFSIPTRTEAEVIADTSRAQRDISDFMARFGELRGTIVYRATREGPAGDGSVGGFAAGGAVRGPGTETSDSIPALLSHNEHVVTAREVHAVGGHDAMLSIRRAMLSGKFRGGVPGYANGGPVGYNAPTPQYGPATTNVNVAAAELPPIYVQNPFTGEYVQAQIANVAKSEIREYDRYEKRVASMKSRR